MIKINPKIHESWKEVLMDEFQKDYFVDLKEFLQEEKKSYTIYPPSSLIFNAFDKTPFDKLKVVILGQDPYHGPNQAHGLCFSVTKGEKIPPSLRNIYKELNSELGCEIPNHGNLEKWAEQGVLLINATLTVRAGQAASHQKKGWETFTNSVIKIIAKEKQNVVFILWGNYAQSKQEFIDENKHCIIKSVHPSPLSASRGFFGSKPFSQTNNYLKSKNLPIIDWEIS
jgi:uracil-DNA glycosylase